MLYTLKNDKMTVKVESRGAELRSAKANKSGKEYMWQGDEKYWNRTSPVLFPCVGSMKNKQYQYELKTYDMPQHGFARDKEFTLVSHRETEVWFELKEDQRTLEMYPFHFTLQIGYRLEENRILVSWKVINEEEERDMYFSIGAHPAFQCPIHGEASKEGYGLHLDTEDNILFSQNNENGLMLNGKNELKLENGTVLFTDGFFDDSSYIIEDYQASEASLVDPDGKCYITVSFDAPLFCVWSPEKKDAPFVCLEPWFGRCDRETFEGRLEEREWDNKLSPHQVFDREYTITFEEA